jgi:methylenetetrahydrofolate dehydrogenase (NADP+) / methenyltetrahydrofolate cyclohydrolase
VPLMIAPEMVKPGAAVVDTGNHRVEGRLVGDVDPRVAEVAGALTPVPGGVGPMTVAMLMSNTITAAIEQAGRGA